MQRSAQTKGYFRFACLATLAAGSIAGFLAGGAAGPDLSTNLSLSSPDQPTGSFALASAASVAVPALVTPAVASVRASTATEAVPEIAPATAVATRFPAAWTAPPPRRGPVALAAHSPGPTQQLPDGLVFNSTVAPALGDAEAADSTAPQQALAYAPAEASPDRGAPAESRSRSTGAEPPAAKRASRPAPAAQPRTLFNDAQIASIKTRLKLTESQERYWPAVAQALRAIEWRRAKAASARAQSIDPNSPEVQQLKSAAIPLVLSMREEQKQEVRMLAHTMGLSQVAAQF
jgi:hypothetical protein